MSEKIMIFQSRIEDVIEKDVKTFPQGSDLPEKNCFFKGEKRFAKKKMTSSFL